MTKKTTRKIPEKIIKKTVINNYQQLVSDAEHLYSLTFHPNLKDDYNSKALSRASILLYLLSLEAFIDRVLNKFLPKKIEKYLGKTIKRMSLKEKWILLPTFCAKSSKIKNFDVNKQPWNSLFELITIRNNLVHPSLDRADYIVGPFPWEKPSPKNIPKEAKIAVDKYLYSHTKFPVAPNEINVRVLEKVRKIVIDVIDESDKLLEGKITKNNWLRENDVYYIEVFQKKDGSKIVKERKSKYSI